MRAVMIVIPLYKASELIQGLFQSLTAVDAELRDVNAQVLLINDSANDEPLRLEMERHLPGLRQRVDVDLIINPKNIGFFGSVNIGLRRAIERDCDVLLLNSDALVTAGAVSELKAVAALDPLTAVVSPRSNNATLCNSPYPSRFRALSFASALTAHREIERKLPRVTYVPTAVGFCLYIRYQMLKEFGIFDPAYGAGYNGENDFIMRCNRYGYRAVLANFAFVYHIGSVSFSQSRDIPAMLEARNSPLLRAKYPEYNRAVSRYFSSVDYRAQTLLAGLVPDETRRRRLLVDCTNLGLFHNGTFELTRNALMALVRDSSDRFEIFAWCTREAAVFHGLDRIAGLNLCHGDASKFAPFAAAVRFAQPFAVHHLVGLADLAPVTCFLILDTIALDCLALDDAGLDTVWRATTDIAGVLGYISAFSQRQFHRRFSVPDSIVEFVALCATDSSAVTRTKDSRAG